MKYYLPIIFTYLFVHAFAIAKSTKPIQINIHSDNLTDFNEMRNKALPNSGITSASNNLLFSYLTANLKFDYMTFDRSKLFMQKGENICVTDRIKTKSRLDKFIFSKPVNLFLGRRLYQNLNSEELQDEFIHDSSAVDLKTLFKNFPDKTILLSKQISYGEDLDKILSSIPKKNKIYRNGSAHDTGVLHMFAKGRVNYALFYPQQLFEYNIDINASSYEIYGVKPYVIGYLMCTNTPEMKLFIKQVNRALERLYQSKELLNLHLSYLKPNTKDIFTYHFINAIQAQ